MDDKIIIKDSEDYYKFLYQELGCFEENIGGEYKYKVAKEYGEGYLDRIVLRNGIEINITDIKLKKNVIFNYKMEKPCFEIGYCIEGNAECYEREMDSMVRSKKDHICIYIKEKSSGWMKYPKGRAYKSISIVAYNPFSQSFKDIGYLPYNFNYNSKIDDERKNKLYKAHNILPEIKVPFNQIWNCNFEGIAKIIYFESKAMEIISLTIEKEILIDKKIQNMCHINENDKKRLSMARKIIIENITYPLTIKELSKRVGLNTYKLKVGFKVIYGNTIFGYIRDIRMEKARILLEDKEKKICDIANEVGYSNPSHFSAAFKKKYGVNPKDFRFGV